MNVKIQVVSDKKRQRPAKSEVKRLCADITKAKTLLKWKPRYSLDDGLKETIEWFRAHQGIYKEGLYNV